MTSIGRRNLDDLVDASERVTVPPSPQTPPSYPVRVAGYAHLLRLALLASESEASNGEA